MCIQDGRGAGDGVAEGRQSAAAIRSALPSPRKPTSPWSDSSAQACSSRSDWPEPLRSSRFQLGITGRPATPSKSATALITLGDSLRSEPRPPLFDFDCEQHTGTSSPPSMCGTRESLTVKAGLLQHPDGSQVFWVSGCPHRCSIAVRRSRSRARARWPRSRNRVPSGPSGGTNPTGGYPPLDAVDSSPAGETPHVFNDQVVARSGIQLRAHREQSCAGPIRRNRGSLRNFMYVNMRFVGFQSEEEVSGLAGGSPEAGSDPLRASAQTDSRPIGMAGDLVPGRAHRVRSRGVPRHPVMVCLGGITQ